MCGVVWCGVMSSNKVASMVGWLWQVKMGPLSVSPMRFGTWAWGTTASISLIFDTADSYGTGKLNGQGEKLLGRFIREFQGFITHSFLTLIQF